MSALTRCGHPCPTVAGAPPRLPARPGAARRGAAAAGSMLGACWKPVRPSVRTQAPAPPISRRAPWRPCRAANLPHLDVRAPQIPVEQRQGVPHHLIDIADPTGDAHDHSTAAQRTDRHAACVRCAPPTFGPRVHFRMPSSGRRSPPPNRLPLPRAPFVASATRRLTRSSARVPPRADEYSSGVFYQHARTAAADIVRVRRRTAGAMPSPLSRSPAPAQGRLGPAGASPLKLKRPQG